MVIPIISPEEVETDAVREKKIKKAKKEMSTIETKEIIETGEKGEEDILTKTWGEVIGKEGEVEGKEEEILQRLLKEVEKEERKRRVEERKREKEEEEPVFIGPLAPRLVTAKKEHIHEKPITPTENACCNKLCKDLNDEIFNKEGSLGATITTFIKGAGVSHRGFPSIPYIIEALKDYRYLLNNNDVCKCYEETKEIEAPLPVIGGKPSRLISAKTGKPIVLSPDIPRFQLPVRQVRIAHRKDQPVIPTHNGCCIKACNILTKEISKMENMLDEMELRGGKVFGIVSRVHPRYEALSFKTSALQEYRAKLTKKGICECIK